MASGEARSAGAARGLRCPGSAEHVAKARGILGPDAMITWLVYKPGYVDRGQQEHQDLIANIDSVRDLSRPTMIPTLWAQTERYFAHLPWPGGKTGLF